MIVGVGNEDFDDEPLSDSKNNIAHRDIVQCIPINVGDEMNIECTVIVFSAYGQHHTLKITLQMQMKSCDLKS